MVDVSGKKINEAEVGLQAFTNPFGIPHKSKCVSVFVCKVIHVRTGQKGHEL